MPPSSSREPGPQLPRLVLPDTTLENGLSEGQDDRISNLENDVPDGDYAGDGVYPSNALGDLLRTNSTPRPDRENPTEFWPKKCLKEVMTKARIREAFKSPKLEHLLGRVDTIMTTHFKILAILALMEKLKYIEKFMDNGICDQDLPLIKCTSGSPVASNIARRKTPQQPLGFLRKWSTDQREAFLRRQYCVSPPTLTMGSDPTSSKHENFPDQTIMPWTSALKQKEEGGYSQVFAVEIHPDCHRFREVLISLSIHGKDKFAIKKLTKEEDQDPKDVRLKFENEKRMLERFRGHPHLVTLLMSWTLREEHYFLFPYAESDLEGYWKMENNWAAVNSPNADHRYESLCWISRQIYMMVEALEHIHNLDKSLQVDKRFGRHGDLKPENVLWYRSTKDARGFFAIADLGLAACNSEHSRSGIPSNSVGRTPEYRSPECDLDDGKISRSYDIWTLGCLLLEMACWILGGPTSRTKFRNERTSTYVSGSQSDIFFDVEEKPDRSGYVMLIKKSVEKVSSLTFGSNRVTNKHTEVRRSAW